MLAHSVHIDNSHGVGHLERGREPFTDARNGGSDEAVANDFTLYIRIDVVVKLVVELE